MVRSQGAKVDYISFQGFLTKEEQSPRSPQIYAVVICTMHDGIHSSIVQTRRHHHLPAYYIYVVGSSGRPMGAPGRWALGTVYQSTEYQLLGHWATGALGWSGWAGLVWVVHAVAGCPLPVLRKNDTAHLRLFQSVAQSAPRNGNAVQSVAICRHS